MWRKMLWDVVERVNIKCNLNICHLIKYRRHVVVTGSLGSSWINSCSLASFHTSIPVTQEVSIDIVDVGVDGGTAGDAARGHVGVILWVDILKALPWHTRAELWGGGGLLDLLKLHKTTFYHPISSNKTERPISRQADSSIRKRNVCWVYEWYLFEYCPHPGAS